MVEDYEMTPRPWRFGLGEDKPHLDYSTQHIVSVATYESKHGLGELNHVVLEYGEWRNDADREFALRAVNEYDALREVEAMARQYLDTGRGDLDGALANLDAMRPVPVES